MDYLRAKLVKALIDHFRGEDRRIDHALRVTYWAERILEVETGDRDVVLAVGLLHDVGIREAEERHGTSTGKLQELYGPPIVRRILEEMGLEEEMIAEACAIVGAHHTLQGVGGMNFPILWDADLMVNLRDDLQDTGPEKMEAIIEKSFRTPTGRELAKREFLGPLS